MLEDMNPNKLITELKCRLPLDCGPFADYAVDSKDFTIVVSYYKHMGASSTARGSMMLEAKTRVGSMFWNFRKRCARITA